jgi:hypothetical protein
VNYSSYTDKDILEAYQTMMDYSGKAEKSVLDEIENRGGLKLLQGKTFQTKEQKEELLRIKKEIHTLYKSDEDVFFIKKSISSKILKQVEVSVFIDETIRSRKEFLRDNSITKRTVIGSSLGFILSLVIGTAFWYFIALRLGEFHILSHAVFVITYFIVRLFTKQSKNNILVFISSFSAAFFSILIAHWLIVNNWIF